MSGRPGKPKPQPTGPQPVTVTLHAPLLALVRETYPAARYWHDNQVVAACVAMALTHGKRVELIIERRDGKPVLTGRRPAL